MKIDCAYDELVEIHKLIPNPKNNNRHSIEQIERLAKIIDYQGMRAPIVVSKRSGFVVKGHCRLSALQKLGWEKAPIDYQEYESEAQEYADLTADNEIARWSELDMHQVHVDMAEMDLDIEMLGLKNFTSVDDEEVEFPELNAGDKDPLQQMTFTLSNDQVDQVKAAVAKAKEMGPLEDEINHNSNGNALSRVCELFLNEC